MIKRFTIQVASRIFIILLFCVLLSYSLQKGFWFSTIGICIVIILLVVFLIKYVSNTNYSLVKFLEALKNVEDPDLKKIW